MADRRPVRDMRYMGEPPVVSGGAVMQIAAKGADCAFQARARQWDPSAVWSSPDEALTHRAT